MARAHHAHIHMHMHMHISTSSLLWRVQDGAHVAVAAQHVQSQTYLAARVAKVGRGVQQHAQPSAWWWAAPIGWSLERRLEPLVPTCGHRAGAVAVSVTVQIGHTHARTHGGQQASAMRLLRWVYAVWVP